MRCNARARMSNSTAGETAHAATAHEAKPADSPTPPPQTVNFYRTTPPSTSRPPSMAISDLAGAVPCRGPTLADICLQ